MKRTFSLKRSTNKLGALVEQLACALAPAGAVGVMGGCFAAPCRNVVHNVYTSRQNKTQFWIFAFFFPGYYETLEQQLRKALSRAFAVFVKSDYLESSVGR